MQYTYLLKHIPTNTFYYGVQYGKKSNPINFWIRYFTSSKYVHKLIEEYGKESFTYEIRKTFNTTEQAQNWEKKVLRRLKVDQRKDFINKNPGLGFGYSSGEKHWAFGKKYTQKHIENNVDGQKKNPAWSKTPKNHPSRKVLAENAKKNFTGKKQTQDHINKRKMFGNKNGMYGKSHTDEHKKFISDYMKLISKLPEFKGSNNLRNSCKDRMKNGTHPSQMIKVCEFCGKTIKSLGNYTRWHGENCKSKG